MRGIEKVRAEMSPVQPGLGECAGLQLQARDKHSGCARYGCSTPIGSAAYFLTRGLGTIIAVRCLVIGRDPAQFSHNLSSCQVAGAREEIFMRLPN